MINPRLFCIFYNKIFCYRFFRQADALMFCLLSTVGYFTVGHSTVSHSTVSHCATELPVQLARVYNDEIDVSQFLVSEKYDGVRAIWKKGQLQTRNGNILHAPAWFLEGLPDVWLDGELWSQRQDFEFVTSTVRKKIRSIVNGGKYVSWYLTPPIPRKIFSKEQNITLNS